MDELGRRPAKAHRIAVIGGGFTGAAFVIHAARLIPRSLEIDLIEPSAALGRGLAYSAIDPLHRINVPSSRMSLFADRPADATDWLFRNGTLPGDGSSTDEAGHHYVSRSDFGAYVANTLEETLTAADGRVRLRRHRTLATGLRRTDDGWSLAACSIVGRHDRSRPRRALLRSRRCEPAVSRQCRGERGSPLRPQSLAGERPLDDRGGCGGVAGRDRAHDGRRRREPAVART
jgi:FAD-NAD(P)-binding protein